jgi:hypothetical protein
MDLNQINKMSDLDIVEAWSTILMNHNPIQIYWNDDIIWDDNVDLGDWISLPLAFKKWKEYNPNYKKYMVENINIEIVEFHHSIVRMYGKEVK